MNFDINSLDFDSFKGKSQSQIEDELASMNIQYSSKIEILKCLNELKIVQFDPESSDINIQFRSKFMASRLMPQTVDSIELITKVTDHLFN